MAGPFRDGDPDHVTRARPAPGGRRPPVAPDQRRGRVGAAPGAARARPARGSAPPGEPAERPVVSVEEQLRSEAAGRPLAIAGAVAGALLQLGGSIWREVAFRGAPSGKHKEARSLLFVH